MRHDYPPLALIQQPEGTSLCGQCVVAMLTCANLDDVIAFMGTGRSYPRDVQKAAKHFGCHLAKRGAPAMDDRGPEGERAAALIMSKVEDGRKYTHWLAWDRERWLDPKYGELANLSDRYNCAASIYVVEDYVWTDVMLEEVSRATEKLMERFA